MIDPVLVSFEIGTQTIEIRWYGIILMLAVVFGTWLAEREFRRRGGPPDFVWNALIWVLPAGVIGARLWYVLNATMGGSTYYTENVSRVFNISEGGLHIFGGLLLGGLAAYLYTRSNQADWLMILDSIAPSLLLAQALARPANFINQELYGPPTDLPWGIPISGPNRLVEWSDLAEFPVETTRFHPTFAYEMVWNLITGGALLYFVRKNPEKFKPGAAFAIWLILAGAGRFLIEFFRPDQPLIPGTLISYSRLFAALMALFGALWLLVRYEKVNWAFWKPGADSYSLPRKWLRQQAREARKRKKQAR